MHVKRDDIVMVLTGKDQGKTGKILRIIPRQNRVIVEGINLVKRHMRSGSPAQPGGILEKEGAIDISNVLPYCSRCNHAVKPASRYLDDGSKVRYCRRCNELISKG